MLIVHLSLLACAPSCVCVSIVVSAPAQLPGAGWRPPPQLPREMSDDATRIGSVQSVVVAAAWGLGDWRHDF
jgi:hypothetical protein